MATVEMAEERISSCPKGGEVLSGTVQGDALVLRVKEGYRQRNAMIAALLEERQGYESRAQAAKEAGDGERAKQFASRVKQVDSQLAALGYDEESGG